MLVFDQLKKDDPQLRAARGGGAGRLGRAAGRAVVGAGGVGTDYQANLETQSFRTVRIPAVRGRFWTATAWSLAENRPTYNVSLYLEETAQAFRRRLLAQAALARAR